MKGERKKDESMPGLIIVPEREKRRKKLSEYDKPGLQARNLYDICPGLQAGVFYRRMPRRIPPIIMM
jgi:hypothetical protein